MRRLVPRIWAGAWRASSMVARDAPVIPRPVCFRNARRLTSDGAPVLVRSSMPGSPRSSPDGERAERFGECRAAARALSIQRVEVCGSRSHRLVHQARSAEAVRLSLQSAGTVRRLQHRGVVRPPDPAAAIFAVVFVVVGAQDLLASLRVSQPDVAAQHIAGPLASRPIAGHPVEVALQLHLPDMTDAGRDLIDLRGARLHLLGELPSVRHEPVPAGMKRRENCGADVFPRDRKSTRLNSSHGYISYAVFCLKKKKKKNRKTNNNSHTGNTETSHATEERE